MSSSFFFYSMNYELDGLVCQCEQIVYKLKESFNQENEVDNVFS